MAYQHLSGRPEKGASAAGYKVIAATPDIRNVFSDDEIGVYTDYAFTSGEERPVKFCHLYSESRNCFVQSAVSYMQVGAGRALSVAHTLVLSDAESEYLLNEHVCPFCPAMFTNAKSDDLKRPPKNELPPLEYKYLYCRDRDYNTSAINKFFSPDTFARLMLAMMKSSGSEKPVYIALPGAPREISYNAIRLMNVIIPAFPSECRKKLGFMTHVTEIGTLTGIKVYFTEGIDLTKCSPDEGFLFDLTRKAPFVSGVEASEVKENTEILRAFITNVFSYSYPTLIGFYNDILPKLDEPARFSPDKIKEIFSVWKCLSVQEKQEQSVTDTARTIDAFYDLAEIADDKKLFLSRINGYWENEVNKCKKNGYAPDIAVFGVINRRYPSFDDNGKRQAQRIWAFVLIYTVTGGNTTLLDRIFTREYEDSELVADIYRYILYTYLGTLTRKDKKNDPSGIYGKIIAAYAGMAGSGTDTAKLFAALKATIEATDRFYSEMGADPSGKYKVFMSGILTYFEESVNTKLTDAGMMRRFAVINDLRDTIHDVSDLGATVFEHFRASFVTSMASCFTTGSISKIADDRKTLADLIERIEKYPELGSIEMIALLLSFWELINKPRDITSVTVLGRYVNKPSQQKAFTEWVEIYGKKYPELIFSIISNASCRIGDGASIIYSIDFTKAFNAHYENIGRDDEAIMRDINRLIPEIESFSSREEYRSLGMYLYKEPAARFVNTYLLDRSADKKRAKENEANLKRYENVRTLLASIDTKHKKK